MASLFVVVALVWLPVAGPVGVPLAPIPLPSPTLTPGALPAIDAGSWIIYDESLDLVRGSFNPDQPLPMASTTKIMTALVVLERAAPGDLVTISGRAAATGNKEVGLVPGEQWTVKDLLGAMLVGSANDAATALAEHVAGSSKAFAGLMNDKARELGLTASYFTNPHGLDGRPHVTSARDLLTTARAAMAYPLFAELVDTPYLVFPPAPDGTERAMVNTNTLLTSYPGVVGVKTGWTREAGRVLVALYRHGAESVWVVAMGSSDAFRASTRLLDYAVYDFTKLDWHRAFVRPVFFADRRAA